MGVSPFLFSIPHLSSTCLLVFLLTRSLLWNWRYAREYCIPSQEKRRLYFCNVGWIDRKTVIHPLLFQSAITHTRWHPEGLRSSSSSTLVFFVRSPRGRITIRRQWDPVYRRICRSTGCPRSQDVGFHSIRNESEINLPLRGANNVVINKDLISSRIS